MRRSYSAATRDSWACLLREDRQADQQQLHAVRRTRARNPPAGEGGMLAQRLSVDRAVPLQDEADLDAAARQRTPACAGSSLAIENCRLRSEKMQSCFLAEARLPFDGFPLEILGLHQDRFAIARLRIDELALVDVLPDRLIGVLVALLARRELADALEDALLEGAELLHLVHGLLQARRADEADAARAAELQCEAQPLGVALLRPVGRALPGNRRSRPARSTCPRRSSACRGLPGTCGSDRNCACGEARRPSPCWRTK